MYVFGIDIGGTRIKIGFFDENHNLLDKWSIETVSSSLFKDLAGNILSYLNTKNISTDEIIGYGIGIPGYVKDGIALNCVNLKWKNVNVKEEFTKAIGYDCNVAIYNDAKLAAYGEYVKSDKAYSSIVFITLGTGIGGGIITNGVIQDGASGLCGEIGHILVDDEIGFKCSCGRRGCFETVASATGIKRLANYYNSIYNINYMYTSAKHVMESAKDGREGAVLAVEKAAKYIARVFSTLSLTIDPNAFIIGGGVSDAGDFLLDKIKRYYETESFVEARNTDIIISKLKNDAGIYGASAFIIKKFKEVS